MWSKCALRRSLSLAMVALMQSPLAKLRSMSRPCRTICAARCRISFGTHRSSVWKTGKWVTHRKLSTQARSSVSRGQAPVRTARSMGLFPSNLYFLFALLLFPQIDKLDLRKTALKSTTPSDEIVRLDINNDGKPDILERWWHGKRVRWLDENGDMLPTDTRGDQVGDVMQI